MGQYAISFNLFLPHFPHFFPNNLNTFRYPFMVYFVFNVYRYNNILMTQSLNQAVQILHRLYGKLILVFF